MLQLARAIVGVGADVLRLIVSFLRSSSAIRAENLVLRKQLASYIERGIKPRRVDFNVTANPTADWTLQQLRELIGDNDGHYKYLIHDRDRIFATHPDDSVSALGAEVLRSPIASRKANAICERVIGTIEESAWIG